jgi:SAM (Sterile alpha motif) domain-containing protein
VSRARAAMQEIADWLEKLGMSEYAQRFAEHRVDFSALPDLTDADLKDLGVVLGDRRKILRAIATLDAIPETAVLIPIGAAKSNQPQNTANANHNLRRGRPAAEQRRRGRADGATRTDRTRGGAAGRALRGGPDRSAG